MTPVSPGTWPGPKESSPSTAGRSRESSRAPATQFLARHSPTRSGCLGHGSGIPSSSWSGWIPIPAQTILNDLGERVRGGRRLHAGQRIVDLLQGGYEVELLAVDDSADERAPLSVANRLYGHGGLVDALQVVLPDQHYRLPWDPGFAAEMRTAQPLLGRRASI